MPIPSGSSGGLFSLQEFASYLRRPLTEVDQNVAGLLLELTEGVINDAISGYAVTASRIKAVALEVAARAYRNPDGLIAETLDDWSGRRPEDVARAGVYLTESERTQLLAAAGVPATSGGWSGSMAYWR